MQLNARWFSPPVKLSPALPLRLVTACGCLLKCQPAMRAKDDDIAAARSDREDWDDLIAAIAAHQDRRAFAELFKYFAPRIKTYMQRSGVGEAAAEELAQETMLSVWRKAAQFDRAGTAGGWIFSIARNLRIDAFRRDHRQFFAAASEIEADFQIDESPLADSQMATAQSEARVRAALTELFPEQLRVVELSFFEEKAHAEIAQILNIPLGTVKSRLRLAINRLRGRLGD
jgi:RNA polymerase sigma-70 factor (ECF subfamily)